jgi:hypothetical protein
MNKFWEVQKKFVIFSHRIRTLDLTKLALKTSIHDLICFCFANFPYVTVVSIIDKGEKQWKTIAILEAHSTAVANFESAVNFPRQGIMIPVNAF